MQAHVPERDVPALVAHRRRVGSEKELQRLELLVQHVPPVHPLVAGVDAAELLASPESDAEVESTVTEVIDGRGLLR